MNRKYTEYCEIRVNQAEWHGGTLHPSTTFLAKQLSCLLKNEDETETAETMKAKEKTQDEGKKTRKKQTLYIYIYIYMVHREPREQSAIIKYDETVAIKPPLRSIVSRRVFAENLLVKTHRLKDEEDGVHLESKILYRDSCSFLGRK